VCHPVPGPPGDQVAGQEQNDCPGDGGEPGGQVEAASVSRYNASPAKAAASSHNTTIPAGMTGDLLQRAGGVGLLAAGTECDLYCQGPDHMQLTRRLGLT
jgi:hypothetical protein